MIQGRKNVYTVGQVNTYIKNMFAQDFLLHRVCVKGEVSNCKYHTSGHIYFTLKDATGTISGVMFAGNRRGLAFRMKEGDRVVVTGSIEVYERDGKYQLYAKEITLDGEGDLYLRYEALKRELEEMGMFAQEYKKPIPRYVKRVGIVTAPTGAAIQDIRNIASRRNPYVQLILYPALVQGEGAAESIVNGIHALDLLGVDVMIVGRGGGSIEDLWAFNEEIVARAIFECETPVISAVGHETDTTIADYVADLRAPTPSAAAELAVYDVERLMQDIASCENRLNRLMKNQAVLTKNRLLSYAARLKVLSPEYQLNSKKQYAAELEDRLGRTMRDVLNQKRHRMELLARDMDGLSPLKKLSQGFSFVSDMEGKNLSGVDQVETGDHIKIQMTNGCLEATVDKKEEFRRNIHE
ncbi:MAG: exodeoxyribonuclease VII large subunit [Lachnospiraceae bacterium]|nr:exodeoxyribonuclease VII large subunit [Lachnospiraceae bacterium]